MERIANYLCSEIALMPEGVELVGWRKSVAHWSFFASTHWFLGRISTLVFDHSRVIVGSVFGRLSGAFCSRFKRSVWGLLWTPFSGIL